MIASQLLFLVAATSVAKVHLTTEEALALAFQDCSIEERTAYLSAEQRQQAAALAGSPVESGLVRQYVGVCDGAVAGTAYFDTHRVRSLPETLMVVINPDGHIARVEVLSFTEPEQYLPPTGFFGQFAGKDLDALSYKKSALRRVTGATMSSNAALSAARRTLALHRVIAEEA